MAGPPALTCRVNQPIPVEEPPQLHLPRLHLWCSLVACPCSLLALGSPKSLCQRFNGQVNMCLACSSHPFTRSSLLRAFYNELKRPSAYLCNFATRSHNAAQLPVLQLHALGTLDLLMPSVALLLQFNLLWHKNLPL